MCEAHRDVRRNIVPAAAHPIVALPLSPPLSCSTHLYLPALPRLLLFILRGPEFGRAPDPGGASGRE